MKLSKLDSLRGFAAIYVMLSHLSSNYLHLQHSWIGQPFRFGREGVLLFFLLSGFVIYYSWHEHSGTKDFGYFFYKRFRRIYPIFILSLLLAYAVICIKYGMMGPKIPQLVGNLLMVQGYETDPGWFTMEYMHNGPLWSLSYEWWFYMMFYPLYLYVPAARQKWVVLALALVGIVGGEIAPNIFLPDHGVVSDLVVWGRVRAEFIEHKTFTLRRQAGTLVMLALMGLVYGGVVYNWAHHGGKLDPVEYPLENFRYYAAGIVLILLFFAWHKTGFRGFAWTLGPFKIFAEMSYALYVFHFPIICNLPPYMPASLTWLDVAWRVGLVLVLAYLAEEVWQRRVNRWMDRVVWGKRER